MKKQSKNKKKWSSKHEDATFGFWNPWSYCNKRHEYVKSLKIDVLGLGGQWSPPVPCYDGPLSVGCPAG